MISTAAQTELDFLRPHLEGQAGYSQEDIAALVSSCEQAAASSFIQHLVSLGLLSGSAARTLSAVQKGYATVPVASLLVGLRRPGAEAPAQPDPASAAMVLRPSLSASLQALVAPEAGRGPPRELLGGPDGPGAVAAPRPLAVESGTAPPSQAQRSTVGFDPRASDAAPRSTFNLDVRASDAAPRAFNLDVRASDAAPRAFNLDVRASDAEPRAFNLDVRASDAAPRAIGLDVRASDAAPRATAGLDVRASDAAPRAIGLDVRASDAAPRASDAAPRATFSLVPRDSDAAPRRAVDLSFGAPSGSPAAPFTQSSTAAGPERFAALQAQLRAFDAGAPTPTVRAAERPPLQPARPPERPPLEPTAAVSEAAARAAFGSGALPAGALSTASIALRSRARETALRALDSAIASSGPPRDTLVSPPRPALPEPEYGTAVPAELVQRAHDRAASSKSSSSAFSLEELASSRLKARAPQPASAAAPATGAAPRIPRAGEQLGRYRLQEALGDGSTAMTFRAYHDALAIPVAIKVYRPTERVADSDARARFISEARILAQLEHANIVRVIDVEDQGELPFIVFEYVGAMTLEEVVRASGRLSEERCLRIGRQVSEALNVANARGLLHRDVKPANVLVRKDGSVKLADFGLARELATGPSDLVCGTPAFMAPEAALTPGATDWRADMYGLGATLYFALTGRPPFERATPLDTVRAHIQEPVPPPSTFVAGLDLRVEFVVMKMLEKSPQARFASWTEVLLTFSELERTLAAPTPRRPGTPSTSAGGVSQLMKSLTDLFRKPRA